MDDIEQLILETLSFLEPMSKEMIILDFDSAQLQNLKDFNTDQLDEKLAQLVKTKKVKKIVQNNEVYYQKVMPKRAWWKRFF